MHKLVLRLIWVMFYSCQYNNTLIAQIETPECLILSNILSERKLAKVFSETRPSDTLYFIFKNGYQVLDCRPNSWHGNLVCFLTDSNSVKMANKAELYHHYKNRNEYFIIDYSRINERKYMFEITQPSRSLQVQVFAKRKGKNYKILAMKEYIL